MRSVRRVALVATLVGSLVVAGAGPAHGQSGGGDGFSDASHSRAGGGASGSTYWVGVGRMGSVPSFPSCDWQAGWPGGGGPALSFTLPTIFNLFAGLMGFNPFGGDLTADPSTVQLVPSTAADRDGNGEVDPEFLEPLLDVNNEGYVIGEVANVDFVNKLILTLVGTHEVGTFTPDPNADATDLEDLDDDELSGERYRRSDRYPQIQRGKDPFTGLDLWWDPWFVALEDQTDRCPAGVVYSPRTENPAILLPDLQALAARNLPDVQPVMQPLDRRDGWAYVQVPTDFGVGAAGLRAEAAHAVVRYIDGPGAPTALWAEIVPVATHLVFEPGDGSEPVVCPLSEMRYDAAAPGACSYTYLDASSTAPGDVFRPRLSVLWVGQYRDSLGVTGLVDLASTSASFTLAVAEARPAVQTG